MNSDFEKVHRHRHVRPYNNSNFICSDLWQYKRDDNFYYIHIY